jgi:hypothetical protein
MSCSGSGLMRCSSCFMGISCLLDGPERGVETRFFAAFGISSSEYFLCVVGEPIERRNLQDLNAGNNSEDQMLEV